MNKTKLKVTLFLILSIVSLVCFAVIAALLKGQQIARFDRSVIASVQGMERPWLTTVMKIFTFIGSTQVVIVITLICLFLFYRYLHHRMELILFIILVAGTGILNQVLKLIFQRERPSLHRLIEQAGYSFPSGHSMEAFAMYAALTFLLWRHISTQKGRTAVIIGSILMILCIGISRIYLGVHYPSDVVAAYFASGFWFTICVWWFQWYMEQRYNKRKGM
ncbi:phosphoesterase PA-phosphatase [Paenibacillus pectinilyticus]|uniref:Phosphoesterase PA-phosphatase n=1 Tax=Paenibacillus pectinilyticus TaxID=512399 RepID=A0A1C0ZVY9_9BACL|nr:phosphatase PAP2 family protein [Paenibacillus pectinilyticus]OCT12276.1 phosphoesterase PA-phosphatase [Paenibacillus pectinilyticus]